MESSHAIRFDIIDIFAIITLSNPKKFNALSQESYTQLANFLREADQNEGVYITLLIGEGSFFSAGADLQTKPPAKEEMLSRSYWLPKLINNNLDVASAFYTHSKILVTALNGPVIGLSAALIAHSDFIYAVSDAYLMTPFSSLGLVPEGGSSIAFVQRMGMGKANEALILGKKIPATELAQIGFVNKLFDDKVNFRQDVMRELQETFGDHLVKSSLLGTKALLRRRLIVSQQEQAPLETYAGLDRFCEGIPQAEMAKVVSGQKRHKL